MVNDMPVASVATVFEGFDRRPEGFIAAFGSLASGARVLEGLTGAAIADARLIVRSQLAQGFHAPRSYPVYAVEDVRGISGSLVNRLWSGGRYGLSGMGIAAVVGATSALLVLAAQGADVVLPGGGAPAVGAVVLGSAISFMQIGLPVGAIIEERHIESRRARYQACLQGGGCLLVGQGRREEVAMVAAALLGAGAASVDRFRTAR